jgi:hypothetical protein
MKSRTHADSRAARLSGAWPSHGTGLATALLIGLIAAVLLLTGPLGCSDSATRPGVGLPPDSTSVEAQQMALFLSGQLQPPGNLSLQIDRELQGIRGGFASSYPVLDSLNFLCPWIPGMILVQFTPEAAQQIRTGSYHAWDENNQSLGLSWFHLSAYDSLRVYFVTLSFTPLLHPRRLAELYSTLPGALDAGPGGGYFDHSNVYPRQTGQGMSYLFRKAWGDCESGCIASEFWYFTLENGAPHFVGHWAPLQDPTPPAWWPEARLNREAFDAERRYRPLLRTP